MKVASGAAAILAFTDAARNRRASHVQNGGSGATCGQKGPISSIVGGQNANECEWTWQVGLWDDNSGPFCGGMLIDAQWVLTAAHCADRADFDVVAGDYDWTRTGNKQRIPANKWIPHPNYDYDWDRNDIALVYLDRPVELNHCVGTVCLPTNDVAPGSTCWITGWGKLKEGGSYPDILQEAQVTIISNYDCVNKYDYPDKEISNDMVCAANKGIDSCNGDSGGPLVCDQNGTWSVYGATSWGYGCADPDYPGVYARVHYQRNWILGVLDDYGFSPPTGPAPAPSPEGPAPSPTTTTQPLSTKGDKRRKKGRTNNWKTKARWAEGRKTA